MTLIERIIVYLARIIVLLAGILFVVYMAGGGWPEHPLWILVGIAGAALYASAWIVLLLFIGFLQDVIWPWIKRKVKECQYFCLP
jgi:hypothetical protein